MKIPELKNDANFVRTPAAVYDFMEKDAVAQSKYVAWLEVVGDDIVQRLFAYRLRKGVLQWTEVERQSVDCDYVVRRNVYLTEMSGWRPVYERGEVNGTYYGYPQTRFYESWFNKWDTEDKPMGVCYRLLNMEAIKDSDRYMYSGYQGCYSGNCIKYLKMYKTNPKVEYFGKLGIVPQKSLLKKAEKDKQFVRFLIDNAKSIQKGWYGPKTILYAYKNKITVAKASDELWMKREARKVFGKTIAEAGVDILAIYKWARERRDIALYSYRDYLDACIGLGLNMKDTKVIYPKDFHRMHDLRINEFSSLKAKRKRAEARQMEKKFSEVARKYIPFEIDGEKYAIVMPTETSDLKREGEKLHHCVGRMGYDAKMAKGESIITFVRKIEDKTEPFVTVEFKGDTVYQCYGDHDSTPAADVRQFVEKWVKEVNKKIKTAI